MANIDWEKGVLTPPAGVQGNDRVDWDKGEITPPPTPSGALRRAADTGIDLAKGVIGVPESAVGMADLVSGGQAGKLAEQAGFRPKQAKEYLDTLYTPERKQANQEVAQAEGFFPKVGAMLRNPSTIAGTVVESAPSMLAGAGVARGAMGLLPKLSPIAAGAIGEGAVAAGQNAEQVRQESADGTLTLEQAATLAASGALTGAIGLGAGKVANRLGIGDVETMLAAGKTGPVGQAAGQAAQKGMLRRAGEGFITEGALQELPQSYQEQVAQNIAQGKPWNEGAADAAAQGLLAGGVSGAGGAALPSGMPSGKAGSQGTQAESAPEQGPSWSTSPGAGVPGQSQQTDAGDIVAPDFTTELGAARQLDGTDFTRDIDTSGLSLIDPAEQERARAATIDYSPDADTTQGLTTTPGAGNYNQAGAEFKRDINTDGLRLVDPQEEARARAATIDFAPAEDTTQGWSTELGVGGFRGGNRQEFTRDIQTDGLSLADPSAYVKPSQRLGLNANTGPLSAAAVVAVDGDSSITPPLGTSAPRRSLREVLQQIHASKQAQVAANQIPATTETQNGAQALQAIPGQSANPQATDARDTATAGAGAQADGLPRTGGADLQAPGVTGEVSYKTPTAQAVARDLADVFQRDGYDAFRQRRNEWSSRLNLDARQTLDLGAMVEKLVGNEAWSQARTKHDPFKAGMTARVYGEVPSAPDYLNPQQKERWLAGWDDRASRKAEQTQPAPVGEVVGDAVEVPARQALADQRMAVEPTAPVDSGAGQRNASPAQGSVEPSRPDQEGLTLQSQTEADLRVTADREAAAQQAEQAAKKEERARIQADDQARDDKARADATVGDFELGKSADQQLSGMGDMFDQPNNQSDAPERKGSGASKKSAIQDLGEKIGGARKDTATPTGTRRRRDTEKSDSPAWARRFEIMQIVKGRDAGRWAVHDLKSRDFLNQPKQVGRSTFETEQEARDALPLLAVSLKHRVYRSSEKGADGTAGFEIWREVNDRKRVKVVDQVFPTREDAMAYMAQHAQQIIETNTTFGEADLPKPDNTNRVGVERRKGDVSGQSFMDTFGFRGVEFGNWNNQEERQEVMNAAFDGLLDLADVLNVPPKALSLDGDLSLAFGARGQGLSGARAHYEHERVVMNLTKMQGAGALAHEWFHALDHYFGRQDGKASSKWERAPDGTRKLKALGAERDMASHGFQYGGNSGVRSELRSAYDSLIKSMFRKAEAYVEDTQRADRFVGAARNDLSESLDRLRKDLSAAKDPRYYKRHNKPATADQLAEFDAIAQKLIAGEMLDTSLRSTTEGRTGRGVLSGARWTNDALEQLSGIYKAVRGRSGFDSTNSHGILDRLRTSMNLYSARLKMLADAQSGEEKSKQVPTSFAMDAKSLDQGRGTDYWTTPHEMAARAFQGYVEDRIAEKGGRSPFLNYAPENAAIPTPWGWKRPYPSGEERKAINKAFDKFIGEIKTRETDTGGVAMFSRRSNAGNDLPDVVIGRRLGDLNNHPDYAAAKAGEVKAAINVARELVTDDMVNQVRAMGPDVTLVPVVSVEQSGRNKIPRAVAEVLANRAGVKTADGIAQINSPKRTSMDGLDRLLSPPEFDGDIIAGQKYVLVDDALTQGGTFASLASHIRDNGGEVVGAISLTGKQYSARIAPSSDLLGQVRAKFGDIESNFRAATGYGFDALTESEARYMVRHDSPESIRDRITEAGRLAGEAGNPRDSQSGRVTGPDSEPHSRRESPTYRRESKEVVDAITKRVESTIKAWATKPPVKVLASFDDAPESVKARNQQMIEGGATGEPDAFVSGGTIYIVAGQMNSAADIDRVLFHEALGHLGLRGIFGSDLNSVLDQLATMRRADVAAKAKEYGLDLSRQSDRRMAAEEVLAEMAQTNPQIGFVKRVVAAIRSWLRRNVPSLGDLSLTDDEIIRDYLLPARGFIERGRGGVSAGAPGLQPAFSQDGTDAAFSRARQAIVGDTGRQYTPEQMQAMKNVGFQVDQPTLKERTKDLWKDAGKKLAQGIADQFAPVKDLSKEAYALMRLSKGASGAFEVLLRGGLLKLTDGVYDFDGTKSGGVVDKLLIPLQGEHHDFLRWVAANRAERLAGEGRENLFTPEDIKAFKTLATGQANFDYTIKNGPRAGQTTRDRAEIYRDSLTTFSQFNKNVLDMAEQSGLIDGESRHLWEHEFYVPFYRVADEQDGGVRGVNIKGGMVRQQAFKELKGGKNALNADLLDNTLMNWAHLLDAAAKNRAAKATLEAAEKMGSAIEAPESAARDMAKSINNRNGVVWFMDGGRQRHFLVDDPYLMTALTSLEYAGMRNPVMNAMSTFKHALTVGVTASPFFKVRNLIRDSLQVVAVSPISANPLKNVADGWKLTNPQSEEYFRLMAGGGTIHFGTMLEGSEAKRVQALVEAGVDEASILNNPNKVKSFFHKYVEPSINAYNELGDRGEAVNRASLYNQLTKQGVSHAEASLMARDLMDFSMQGSFTSVRFLTQVVPFFNARIQGLYKLGKSAKEDPARFAAVIGATAALSVGLLAAYSDDDDWKKREDWDRNNYWWFKFGGTAFRIPKPFEIGSIATLAERGVELLIDDEMNGPRFRQQFLTLLGDNLAMNPIPQLVKPMLDVYSNKDSFSGRPIESMGMERLLPQYRFNDSTSMMARGASAAMNSVTSAMGIGGALSPVQIDHMIRGYFGWLGSFVVGASDMLARPATDQPDRAAPDYWKTATGGIASQLDGASSRYVSQMYDQAKEIEQAYGTWRQMIKEGRIDEANELQQAYQQDIQAYHRIERMKKLQSALNAQIREIERNQSMDPTEKRDAITAVRRQQDQSARLFEPVRR